MDVVRRPRLSCPNRPRRRAAYSLPELLVTLGIIALLIAIILPPLQVARKQAQSARCATHLQQIGVALEGSLTEHKFYPVWDDGGSPTRYTWIDVLVQRRLLGNARAGYCPEDQLPSPLNSARGEAEDVLYPGNRNLHGIDYSYGIGVPLSSGGWSWRAGASPGSDLRPRQFVNHDRFTSNRLLAADGQWSAIYNLSGDALRTLDWSYPTQFDNTVAYRHRTWTANILYQDGHVSRLRYALDSPTPVNTSTTFVWYPGEPLHVGPGDQYAGNFYPNEPPVNLQAASDPAMSAVPREVVPAYYTQNRLWTQIEHK